MAREYIPKYVPRGAWKRITSTIQDYPELKEEYDTIQTKTATPHRAAELERKITAFERLWTSADDETKHLVECRFWKRCTYRDIWLPLSDSTMKRYIRNFVCDLGQLLGEI